MTTKKSKSRKENRSDGPKNRDNAGVEVNADRYLNRELSWLEFNDRILSEARDTKHPLLERLKFLSITASNLDEFFIVRVASLRDMLSIQYNERDISGLTVGEQLTRINAKTRASMSLMYSTYSRSLLPSLRSHGVMVLDYDDLDKKSPDIQPATEPGGSDRRSPGRRQRDGRVGISLRDNSDSDRNFANV